MKKVLLGFVFLIISSANIFAQTKEAKKFDEMTDFCCEDTRARLDNFFAEIQNNPEIKGYVIFYEGKNHRICNENRTFRRGEIDLIMMTFENHVSFRNQDPKRFSFVKGGHRENWTAEFWIIPNGAELPKPTPTLEQKNLKYKKGKAKKLELHCP